LTNVAKYAHADTVSVDVARVGDALVVAICDDGVGGADLERGSGLRGLVDRVGAIGGRLELTSPRAKERSCARTSRRACSARSTAGNALTTRIAD
jgi:signal transduction histidine kinase